MLIALAIILLVMALFLTVAVLMQRGKSKKLSGAIAGGADTFFGKNKGSSFDKMLSKVTTVVAVFFALTVIIVYVMQDTAIEQKKSYEDASKIKVTEGVDTEKNPENTEKTPETNAPAGTEAEG